jgi:pantoate--beta-alanine ligase
MDIVRDETGLRQLLSTARARGRRIALVPTMGALHEGHLRLVDAVLDPDTEVVASVFVNPAQFGPSEDLARYPRCIESDADKLEARGCNILFAPSENDVYLSGDATRVRVGSLSEVLCGPLRPGHFEGVATVVTKLFGLTQPDVAIFGRKDYQQLAIIKRLVRDLFLRVEVRSLATVREPGGLAMSSRNAYLNPEERARAGGIARALSLLSMRIVEGAHTASRLRTEFRDILQRSVDHIEYAELADPDSLALVADSAVPAPRTLLATACRVGKTRLIDNVVTTEDRIEC